MHTSTYGFLLYLASLLCAPAAMAGTSLSGYYYVDFTDYVSADEKILISRTFNSQTKESGLYGNKWGTGSASYIALSGDGTAVVHENGTGRSEVFQSDAVNDDTIHAAIKQIVDQLRHDGSIKTDAMMHRYVKAMLEDDAFRVDLWASYVRKGMLPEKIIAVGTVLHATSGAFGKQRLVRTNTGYIRHAWLDTDSFNAQGRIVLHVSGASRSSHQSMKYYWRKDGLLFAVSDRNGEQMLFVRRNNHGAITAWVDAAGMLQTEYRYQDGNLVWSRDGGNHIFGYTYDDKNRMTAIIYSNGTKKVMDYAENGTVISERRVSASE